MENYIKIEKYLADGKDGNISKQRKNPFWGILLLVVGLVVIVLSIRCHLPETVQIACLSLGVLATLVGAVMLVLLSTSDCGGFRFNTTGACICRYRRYIATADRQQLLNCVNAGDMRLLNQVHKETSTGTLLQAYISKDGNYAILQVEEYIPHDFVPITPPVTLDQSNATLLLQWLKN